MAIKTISKLDPYANGDDDNKVGGNVHLYKVNDSSDVNPIPSHGAARYSLTFEEDDFYNLLFEVSKPINSGAPGLTSTEFESYKMTYRDVVKNIILDTKSYLNARNCLGDLNLYEVVSGDYTFAGNKIFKNNVSISGNAYVVGDFQAKNLTANSSGVKVNLLTASTSIYTPSLTATSGNITNLTALNARITNLTATSGNITNLTATSGNITNLTATSGNITNLTALNETLNNLKVKTIAHPNGGSNVITCNSPMNFGSNGLTAGECTLTASAARWSDLAEYYLGDAPYQPGTLVKFGGENEVTVADNEANGVVTSKPAYLMNSGLASNKLGCPIALVGRVPVLVVGPVKKFDYIVLSGKPGIGEATPKRVGKPSHLVGRALETNDSDDVKLVECVVKMSL